ncbi:unnamed protein product, partial [marine sediment metagenome]
LEAAGLELSRGNLRMPVHVGEGSINFDVLGPTPIPATGARYGLIWWGFEAIPEEE